MQITQRVKKILYDYDSDNPGTRTNIARILMHGKMAGTGRMIIFSADHGMENGPVFSFSENDRAFDPCYLHQLAIDSQVSAFAAPLGVLEAGSGHFAGAIPTILKINSSNSLNTEKLGPTQALTGSVKDALRLGCSAISFTIYPGSDRSDEMYEDFHEIAREAKEYGLAVMAWVSPKGGFLSRNGETAIDTIAYSAHIAAQLGAHIIRVNMPSTHIEQPKAKAIYKVLMPELKEQSDRVRHVVQSCFNGRRLLVFSDDKKRETETIYEETLDIRNGNGNGTVLGRELFQRKTPDAIELVNKMSQIYQNKDKDSDK